MKMANLAGRVCSETEQYGLMSPLPALTAAAVYQAAVANDVATEAHDRFVQATLDTMWLPEYED